MSDHAGTCRTAVKGRRPRLVRRRTLTNIPTARAARAGDFQRKPARRTPQLSEFTSDPAYLAELALRTQLVRLRESGNTTQAALQKLNLEPTGSMKRWAQRVYKQFKETGAVADLRRSVERESPVMTPEVGAIVLRCWNGRRGAKLRAVHRMVETEIGARREAAAAAGEKCSLATPSYASLKLFIKELPAAVKMARNDGMDAWRKHARMISAYPEPSYANERWEIDNCRLPIWVRVETSPGVWEAAEVWITVVIDVFSRAIAGFWVSTQPPSAWSTALVMRMAALPKGIAGWPVHGLPEVLVPDHGKDFMAHQTALMLQALGIRLEACPPHYPDGKAHIERWFGTLNSYLGELSGFMEAEGRSSGAAKLRVPFLLSLPQLREEITRFITDYHNRVHGSTGETPLTRWERSVRLSAPSVEDMNVLMLANDRTRKVTKEGISFTLKGNRGKYVAPELQDYLGVEVQLRYNPEDLDSILVYAAESGEYLCEAWRLGTRYGTEDIVRWRRGYAQGLRERTTAYYDEVRQEDRRSARAWDEARDKAADLRSAAAADSGGEKPAGDGADDGVVARLLAKFQTRDRQHSVRSPGTRSAEAGR
jgi:putative transposase